MSGTPYSGIGDTLEFSSVASPTSYETLNGVNDISLPGDKVEMLKTTTMATTNGVDTFISGTQDPGTCEVKGLWYPAETSQTDFEAIRLAGAAVSFKVTYGSSNSCSFSGIIESFSPSFPLDKPATFDAKIKITGPKTYA